MKMPVLCTEFYPLSFYSTQDLTHDVPTKNKSTEVLYIPLVMIITPIIVFTIVRACLQESYLLLITLGICVQQIV